MLNKVKFTFLVIVCLFLVSIGVFGQAVSDSDESALDRKIEELQKQIRIEAKKRKIKELEEELKKTPQENSKPEVINAVVNASQNAVPSTEVKEAKKNSEATTTAQTTTNTQQDTPKGKCQVVELDPDNASLIEQNLCTIAEEAVGNNNEIPFNLMRAEVTNLIASKFISTVNSTNADENQRVKSFFFDSEKKRTDKQIGATSNSSGTTSLVVKGGAPAIIGWAVESGAATSSIDGNTVTVRFNPLNLGKAFLQKQSLFQIRNVDKREDSFEKMLKKLTFGFSFDTSRGTEEPTFIVSKQQLASWSVRYELVNRRNPLSPSNKERLKSFFASQTVNLDKVENAVDLLIPLNCRQSAVNCNNRNAFISPILTKWFNDTNDEINNELKKLPTSVNKITRIELARGIIEKRLNSLPIADVLSEAVPAVDASNNPTTVGGLVNTSLTGFTEGSAGFKQGRDDLLDELNGGMIATFEYTNNREVNAPDTSNFRFIVEKGILGNADFTLNAEATIYNKKPVGTDVKRFKDFNIALQLDAPLKDVLVFNDSVLSFAFRYTRQQGDVVLPNGVIADGTKGDILFGQAKLTIPFFDTGIKFPFSLTFGNRSEFIKEKFTRVNFGLTFDLDQIFKPMNLFK